MNAAAARHGFRDRRPAEYLAAVAALPEGAPDTVCGGCFRTFATLAETFAHDCERVELRGLAAAALTDEELVEVPDRFPVKPGRREAARAAARGDNQYPGPCTSCGATVEPFDGKRAKVDGRWVVRHLACPVEEAPRSLDTPRTHPRDPEPEVTVGPARPNRYDAPCVLCTVLVPAGTGNLSKGARGWEVRHVVCPSHVEVPEEPTTGLDLTELPDGRYAVPGGSRLKLRIDKPTAGEWAGWVFVKDAAEYGAGRRYGKQRPGGRYVGDVEAELTVILADPAAASAAYGRLTDHCGVCGRPLEQKDSVERGIGPWCAEKLGW